MTWNGFGVGVLAVAAAATARGQCPNQAFSMTEHAVGGTPAGVTAGDFNGDGVADIATCLSAGNSVSVLYGTGGGAFAGVVGVPTGAGPVAVVSADFNGDGRADLVTANAGAGNLSVLLSTGSGFAPAAAVSFGAGTPTCLAVGDANGDSRLDVIVGRAGNATLVTMLGDGAGGLAPGGSSSTLSNVSGLAAFYAAAPQDPFLDIATVSSTSLMTAQQGLGNGNFATIQMLTVGQTPQGVATADFDLDGRADIVGSSQSEGAAYVFYGHLQGFSGRDFAGNAQIPRAVAAGHRGVRWEHAVWSGRGHPRRSRPHVQPRAPGHDDLHGRSPDDRRLQRRRLSRHRRGVRGRERGCAHQYGAIRSEDHTAARVERGRAGGDGHARSDGGGDRHGVPVAAAGGAAGGRRAGLRVAHTGADDHRRGGGR
jgi:hypothetical protein